MNDYLNSINEAILNGDKETVVDRVQASLDAGISPGEILNEAMIKAMGTVGKLFEEGEYFVPEMLISAQAMKAGLEILRPLLIDTGIKPIGKVALGTVKGDLHDIGKNLVGMMLEGSGFEIMDLGTDVSPETFVDAVKQGANIVALSALLTTTMPAMAETIKALEAAGLREDVIVLIGGAPVTDDFSKQIFADGFAPDASQASSLAKELIS
jgi:5-methyltetrahydrofolate--homocysteine methyltransferase